MFGIGSITKPYRSGSNREDETDGYEPAEIFGIHQNGGIRQLHQSGGSAALFAVRHQPDDSRPGNRMGLDAAGTRARGGAADGRRRTANAVRAKPMRRGTAAADAGGRAARRPDRHHPNRDIFQRRHPLAAADNSGIPAGLPRHQLRTPPRRLHRDRSLAARRPGGLRVPLCAAAGVSHHPAGGGSVPGDPAPKSSAGHSRHRLAGRTLPRAVHPAGTWLQH